MNILLDFIPFQHNGGIGGAASFTKAVCDEVCLKKTSKDCLFAVYDSSQPIGKQYNYQEYAKEHGIQLLDLATTPLSLHIDRHAISTFFMSIGQFYANYSLDNIHCKVVMGIHDIWDIEREDNHIELIIHDKTSENKWRWAKRIINVISGRFNRQQQALYNHIIPLYSASNTIAFTVSEYSRNALSYYFPHLVSKDIHICYSPSRRVTVFPEIENKELREIIKGGKTYLLMLAANRRLKNAHTLIKVFKRLLSDYPNLYLLTTKYGHSIHSQHIDIPFLSDSDLEHAYQHAYALIFGSFFEGFGYPPIEAIRHGTPCIASNVTSIPEILGDAGIYFSPFYPADMYRAIKTVLNDRNCRKEQITQRYTEISLRQQNDLQALVKEIFTVSDL